MSIFSRKKLPSLTALHEELVEVLKTPDPETELGSIVYRAEKPPEKPAPPEPDFSTKPQDIVGYCFGFACPKKHVQDFFESITIDRYSERRACSKCGGVAKPAVVKRVAEAIWDVDYWLQHEKEFFGAGSFGWYLPNKNKPAWNHYSFFHYLESPKRRKK